MRIVPIESKQSSLGHLADAVDSLGSAKFSSRWSKLAMQCSGAELVSAFRICNGCATVIAADAVRRPELARVHAHRYAAEMYWRDDPVLALVGTLRDKSQPTLIQVDPSRIKSAALRREFYLPANIGDKLAISNQREHSLFVVSLLRTGDSGPFSDSAVESAAEQAGFLLRLLAKHSSLVYGTAADRSLASVDVVEERLLESESSSKAWRLSKRERQVCARIVFGLTAAGIALDLDITEHSVDTYRKRAYVRLGVATRHELLRRYLALGTSPQTVGAAEQQAA